VIEAVADIDVEPRIARGLQLVEPLLPGRAIVAQRGDDLVDLAPLGELRVYAELHGAPREPPHFLVRPEDLGVDAGHHARHGLVADLREGLLAEREEGEVRTVAEQQELEVVVPHPEVPLERLLVRLE
jgi:hypothetical protein